jgi:hypothetical protein
VLVVGVPRSGTSWVGRVLGATAGARYVGEPDSHEHCPFAFRVKRRLGRGYYPALDPGEEAAEYELLWRRALELPEGASGAKLGIGARARRRSAYRLLRSLPEEERFDALRRPDGRSLRLAALEALAVPERPPGRGGPVIVKSVHAQLSVEWIWSRWPVSVVVVLRRPLNVISSWIAMGWLRSGQDMLDELDPAVADEFAATHGLTPPGPAASGLVRAAWLYGLLTTRLLEGLARRPEWHAVVHEELCGDPHGRFTLLAGELGLAWTPEVDALLDEMDRPGAGYEANRVARELEDVWRSRLDPADARRVLDVLAPFPVADWTAPPFSGGAGPRRT